MKKTYTLESSW